MNFDPATFDPTLRQSRDQDTVRVGARFAWAPHSDVIVSYIHTDLDTGQQSTAFAAPLILLVDVTTKQEAHQVEAQYIFRHDRFTATIGGGWSGPDIVTRVDTTDIGIPLGPLPSTLLIFDDSNYNGYIYVNATWPDTVIWTGGLSLESLKRNVQLGNASVMNNPGLDQDKLLPKAGVQWNITDWARLRLAYLQAIKRELVVNRTIEPTQVAGFNQFFDDANGSETQRWGGGLDAVLTNKLYSGVELAVRKVKFPIVNGATGRFRKFDRWEDFARAYLYWTPLKNWAVSVEGQYEKFRRQSDSFSVATGGNPPKVKTVILPAGIRYFHPSGAFASVRGTYVRQKLTPAPTSTLTENTDKFYLVDASIGFRLPKRLGIMSLEVNNLFNQKFFYQDLNIHTGQIPITPRFLPTRTVLGQVTLSF